MTLSIIRFLSGTSLICASFSLISCNGSSGVSDTGGNEGGSGNEGAEVPEEYEFESRFQKNESSVSYSGQTFRHLLINDLTAYIGQLQDEIDTDSSFNPGKVEGNLLAYYEFDSDTQGTSDFLLSTEPSTLQQVYDDISSGKNLAGKMAGQDGGERDHKDWSKEFVGWSDESIASNGGNIANPDGLLRAFLAKISENAILQANGDKSRDGLSVHQTPQGQDLKQLVQKFLLGALAFAQGADDYLDEGLESDNDDLEEGKSYTALEHSCDEAFGYFGASRDYLQQSNEDIASGTQKDSNDDDKIDLLAEYNFGASVNAAKRDKGSASGTDFTNDAMTAFLKGRALITAQASINNIQEQAALAKLTWEKALAATAVHYINELLVDQAALEANDYSFDDHAKHFSELKGFALAFQFNPDSPLSEDDFAKLHSLIHDAPVLADAKQSAQEEYVVDLKAAKTLLKEAYDFEEKDIEAW